MFLVYDFLFFIFLLQREIQNLQRLNVTCQDYTAIDGVGGEIWASIQSLSSTLQPRILWWYIEFPYISNRCLFKNDKKKKKKNKEKQNWGKLISVLVG